MTAWAVWYDGNECIEALQFSSTYYATQFFNNKFEEEEWSLKRIEDFVKNDLYIFDTYRQRIEIGDVVKAVRIKAVGP